jgi:hypothetical protein
MTDTEKAVLEYIFDEAEKDVLASKKYLEETVLPQKCAPKVYEECHKASYDACVSDLPSLQCPGGALFSSEACGDGKNCGTKYDFNNSVLMLSPGSSHPVNGEPNDEVSFDLPLRCKAYTYYHLQ